MTPAATSPGNPEGFGPLQLLVVQPTPYCNLDCDYCYLPNRNDRQRLPLEILEAALVRVLESPYVRGDFTLLWHAGEPLTVPIAFFDEATVRIREALGRWQGEGEPLSIHQSVQTNATLINEAWCDCFERNGISVGVSMDGPAFLHDVHRRTRTGLGTHAATLRGIEHLRRRGIPFQVIAVITEEALGHAEAMFAFFLDNGITDVAFNMEETEGENRVSTLSRPHAEVAYQSFLQRFWELWRERPELMRVREFEGICSLVEADARLEQSDMTHPFAIVNVDARGSISTFDPELLAVETDTYGDFVLGNVLHDSLESIAASAKFQRIHRDMRAGIDRCRSECAYFGLCGGGAGSNKYWEHGSFDCTETQACRYRIKLTADVVLSGLEQLLELTA
ncbi:cyclophane-forming radical SAM/SPASM peptide maturase GrrM/OscB [Cyanobium sp. Morenito 9A2]|uniref:cyclophane-forming radical SAM/SPASM peptide maturase GrrM/OscB n=1 Tax=Cyanobium sp. Morenito 9A2 TaxID=2823718 RepID=UPI0020CE6039|nr:cyclophane-forming radical SAM/SPASM peptide maturase GrrM/OscB [Cyanobium sp. Morenito 9A2]MCP9849989.1 GRRM system radical SAM/SPASM domain protein [Cyanobium sp. Morenito 9A2]